MESYLIFFLGNCLGMQGDSYAAALAEWHRQLREAHRHRALERQQMEAEETQQNEVTHHDLNSRFPPRTGFRCQHMVHPGYYADIEEQCEVRLQLELFAHIFPCNSCMFSF